MKKSGRSRFTRRRAVAGTAAALAALTVAACSSSTSSGAGASSTTSAGGSVGPIKVLVISQLQAPAFSFPEIANGAQASADAINAAGGVNGHKIQVTTCNDQGNPNVAATCGRTAVQGGYADVINTTSLFGASFMPLLQAGQVPAIGGTPLTSADFTSPISFPASGGNPLDYGGSGYVAAKTGCKTAGIIRDTAAATDETQKALQNGFTAGGGAPITTVIKQVGTSPDFSGPVSQIVSSGVDCLLIGEQPQAVVKIVAAVRQSSKPNLPIYTLAVAFPQALVTSLGKAANGVIVSDSIAIPSQSGTPTFWADMTKYGGGAAKSGQALLAWIGVQIVKDVATSAKAYDHAAMLTAANKASNITVEGLASTLNFSEPNPNSTYTRIFANSNYAYKVVNGSFTPLFGGKPQNVSAALK
jgi:ABC-type branched-subunit amino acid transport system substrate-binding protein